jgi:hypothetical protein
MTSTRNDFATTKFGTATSAWRGTLEPADLKRLRQLGHENGRLKKIVADRDLEIDVPSSIPRWVR